MQHRLPHHSVYYIRPSQNGIASYTPINLYFWSLANVNERNVHGSIITACYRSNVIVKSFSYCCVISLLIMCHEILSTFVTESFCKKGIVISTSDLLPESQMSEHVTCMDSKSVNRLAKNPKHITAINSPTH